jgi:hypothetical protein
MKLTGATRFRTTWRGKLVLQVQFWYITSAHGDIHSNAGWRDAKLSDIKATSQAVEVVRDV